VRIALALSLEVEDRLAPDALRHGHEIVARCGSAGELLSRLEIGLAGVAIVGADERYLTERLLAECDAAGTRVIALIGNESDRRRVAALGLLETADASSSWGAIEEQFSRAAGLITQSTAPTPRAGTVVAVWGPAGAPGRTTIAINVAAELAAAGHSVALGDVDTYSGSVAPTLGMLDEAPGFAAACRLAGANALTRAELERIGQRYQSGHGSFWVLTGIGRPSRWPELSGERVEATIEACRNWVDFVVLDIGFSLENDDEIASDLFSPRRNAASIAALGSADRIIAVGSADPVGLSRFLRAHVDLVETVASGRVLVAMNKIRAGAIGLNPIGQVAQTLSRFGGIEAAVMIPFDLAALDAAILNGKTLADVAPKSTARAAIRELVTSKLMPVAGQKRRARRRK
jgi:MinD-like ATPase involved in chromosome partitioning or flagellar assembly